MLNEHERESLREIQQGFASEDPAFADNFTTDSDRLPARRSRTTIFLTAVLIVLTALMIFLGLIGQAFLFAAMILVVLRWRHRGRLLRWMKSPSQ
jgi:hypothetical protein